ncbi:hypothetical protein GQ457_03G019510 [Hibiscus cannabinus]
MNYLARDEINSDMMLDIISGTSHICSSNVQINCYGNVSPRKNKKTFYFIATHRHVEDILEGQGLLQRSYNLVFIGPLLRVWYAINGYANCASIHVEQVIKSE